MGAALRTTGWAVLLATASVTTRLAFISIHRGEWAFAVIVAAWLAISATWWWATRPEHPHRPPGTAAPGGIPGPVGIATGTWPPKPRRGR